MLDKKKIENSVEKHLQGTDKFLVGVEVSATNIVDVYVDGDKGVSIGECAEISRFLESQFNRETEDYELRVSSPGLDRPFKFLRQYKKYINRMIRLELNDGEKLKGKLTSVNEEEIEVGIKAGKKARDTVSKKIPFSDIKSAKPEISFK